MKPNYLSLVVAAKAEILARGIDVDASECARFEVTKLAASRMAAIDPEVGLLYKPSGNNCEERAVDVVCWKDGTIVDVLGAGPEGPNTPLWMPNPNPVDPSRWRPAPVILTAPDRPPRGPDPIEDVAQLREDLRVVRAKVDALERALLPVADQWPAITAEIGHLLLRIDQRYVYLGPWGVKLVSVPESLVPKVVTSK